jgi:hypothetical protein
MNISQGRVGIRTVSYGYISMPKKELGLT